MTRGRLRIYLGYARGVGATHAMLDEGRRRAERGTRVVVAALDERGQIDLDGVLAHHPQVVLIDNLATAPAGGTAHWQGAEHLLDAGIDVVGTMLVGEVDSLADAVAAITGVSAAATVPDRFVTSVDEVQLVDFTPAALRRRIAHGRVSAAEGSGRQVAPAMRGDTFARLRLIALRWLADRAEFELGAPTAGSPRPGGGDAGSDHRARLTGAPERADQERSPWATLIGSSRLAARRTPRWAWVLALVDPIVLTALLTLDRRHVAVATALLADLCLVILIAAVGGLGPGLLSSGVAFVLTNWYLTPPLHTLDIGASQNVVALVAFVLITVTISVLVDRIARRTRESAHARAEAAALARSAATLVGSPDPLPQLLEQVRVTFSLDSAAILERAEGSENDWWPVHLSGPQALLRPDEGWSTSLATDGSRQLVVAGVVQPEQLDVLRGFADQLAMALQSRRLREEAAHAELLAEANALRAALLQAVSHDLRTPLSSIRAAATGLMQSGVHFAEHDRLQLLEDIDRGAERLDRMVGNLLDMTRLQAGAVELHLGPVALEEVVTAALAGLPAGGNRVAVDVPESLPLVLADVGLLERALANILSNALAWSPLDRRVRVEAALVGDGVTLVVADHGPGIPTADRERVFEPFRRLGDRSHDAGAGLGLAIARGFIEAMGATIHVEDTPGGGTTMVIDLLIAPVSEPPAAGTW